MNILITNSRSFLVVIALMFGVSTAMGVYAQESGDKSKMDKSEMDKSKMNKSEMDKSMPKSEKKAGDAEVPVLVLIPPRVSLNIMTEGCWARLYDRENFEGSSLMLVGPINLAQMIGPFGHNWEDKVRSLELGPKANITIYDNRNFRDQDVFISTDKKVPDMSKKMGFLDNFRSMMLTCITD